MVEGSLEAPNINRARVRLQQKYPRVLSVEEEAAPAVGQDLLQGMRRVSTEALAVYTRQLCTMVSAGLPLGRSLKCLAQGDNMLLNQVLVKMLRDVDSGFQLSRAMARYPHAFPVVYTRLVEAGEVSGQLEAVLDKLGNLLEKQVKLQKRMVSAFTYPVMLGASSVGLLLLFVYYILPMIQPIFVAMGVQLPLITRFVLGIARLLQNPWIMVPAVTAMTCVAGAGLVFYTQIGSLGPLR